MKYRTPDGLMISGFYRELLSEEHVLIVGAPGAGKSVLLNEAITTALTLHSPAKVQLILIDPKQVELTEYRPFPHTLQYASTGPAIIEALRYACDLIDSRLTAMSAQGLKKWPGSRVFVVIDELLDIMTGPAIKKTCQPLIQKIAALGRAPAVTLLACTQCPLSTVIPTPIKACFSNRVCLRTACAQDCRNIIQTTGAESFPIPRIEGKAFCFFRRGSELFRLAVPVYPADRRPFLLRYWTSPECRVS